MPPNCQVPNTGWYKNKHSTDSFLHHRRINKDRKRERETEKRANTTNKSAIKKLTTTPHQPIRAQSIDEGECEGAKEGKN